MKFTILPYEFEGEYYFISPYSGNLVVSHSEIPEIKLNNEIQKNIWLNNNPYELVALESNSEFILSEVYTEKLIACNKKLMCLGNKNFLLSCLYSRVSKPIFENTIEAFDYIAKLAIHQEKKGKICLQRTLLAAKTSKSFKKNKGTIFIGAQLPTGIMHAWIIENGIQPDRQDREWIMYKPLLAITF